MKLYNKSGRAFAISKKFAVSGCREVEVAVGENFMYIDPDTTVEVTDEAGEKLAVMYPKELQKMSYSGPRRAAKKRAAPKKKKTAKRKGK